MGKTIDGRLVINFFQMVNTYGVPLDVVVYELHERGYQPGWTEFYEEAIQNGWNSKSLNVKLEKIVEDVYGYEYFVQWRIRMNYYIERYRKIRGIGE